LSRKVVSGVLYPYNSDKSDAEKWEIPTNIDFTATGGPTDLPLIVQGESVGVVG
jgi:hypothetical protein